MSGYEDLDKLDNLKENEAISEEHELEKTAPNNNVQNLKKERKNKTVFKVLKIIALIWMGLGLISFINNFVTGGVTIWLGGMVIFSISPWIILKLIESKKWFYLIIYFLIIILLFVFIEKVDEAKYEEERNAYWDNYNSQTFIITFDTDGGQPIESMAVHPNTYLSPVIPHKIGYEFENWTLNGTVFNFSGYVNSRITSDITLKANYVKSNTTSNNNNSSNSGSYNNSYNSTSYGYQKIYNEYSQKLINSGATSSISEMADILTEGTIKMAQYMYSAKGTDGQYATYQSWVDKLYTVYINNCR